MAEVCVSFKGDDNAFLLEFSRDKNSFSPENVVNFLLYQGESYSVKLTGVTRGVVAVDLYLETDRVGTFLPSESFEFRSQDGHSKRFFPNLYYGFVMFELHLRYADGSNEVLYSKYVPVEDESDVTNENIEQLMKEIYQISGLLNNEYSDLRSGGKVKGDWLRNTGKSVKSYLSILKDIISFYHENYEYFKSRACHKIKQTQCVKSFDKVRNVSRQSLKWLMQNASVLQKNPQKAGVLYRNEYYIPSRIQGDDYSKNTDIYENRVLVGFLKYLKLNCRALKEKLENDIVDSRKMLGLLKANSVAATLKRVQMAMADNYLREFNLYEQQLDHISNLYLCVLPVGAIEWGSMPRYTKIFQEIKQYRQLYEYMIKWNKFGEFSLEKESILFNVHRLDTLFEYYCLLRLVGVFLEHGWQFSEAEKYVYDLPPEIMTDIDVDNMFYFNKGETDVVLYYQPVIYGHKFENGIELYRVNRNEKGKDSFYMPDFLIKSIKNKTVSYAIFDAKYSDRNTILNKRMPDVLTKYICSLADKNATDSIKMVWLLQGRVEEASEKVYFHQGTSLAQQYYHGPSIGIQPVFASSDIGDFWREIERTIL